MLSLCLNVWSLSWPALLYSKHTGSHLGFYSIYVLMSDGYRRLRPCGHPSVGWLRQSTVHSCSLEVSVVYTVSLNRGSAKGESLSYKLRLVLIKLFLFDYRNLLYMGAGNVATTVDVATTGSMDS